MPVPACRLVVLVSGAGTNLQALLDASADPAYGAEVVAAGADRDATEGLMRANKGAVPTFVCAVGEFPTREDWDRALSETVASYSPDLVVLAGFLKLVGPEFLTRFAGRVVNTHPALCPAFPGTTGPADALAYGVKVTGATLFVVDEGVDTGPVIAQTPVTVYDEDDAATLHERIKVAERTMLVATVGRIARGGLTITDRKVRIGA